MSRFKDFDQAMDQEVKRVGPSFKKFGRMWQLPPSMSAGVMLEMAAGSDGNGGVTQEAQFKMALALFGDPMLRELTRLGLTSLELVELTRWAIHEYSPQAEDELSEEGNAGAPNAGGAEQEEFTGSARRHERRKAVTRAQESP